MNQYIYDGTFAGLLTVFADPRELEVQNASAMCSSGEEEQEMVFGAVQRVVTDPSRAILMARILGRETLDLLYRAFRSEQPQVELLLQRYVRALWFGESMPDTILSEIRRLARSFDD